MPHGASSQPALAVCAHELIVGEMRIGRTHAVDRFPLTWAQAFVRIKAPDAGQQPLPAQNFMTAGDDAMKVVGGVEHGGVGVGDLGIERQQRGRNVVCGDRSVNAIKEFDGFLDPDAPVPEQAALDPQGVQCGRPLRPETG